MQLHKRLYWILKPMLRCKKSGAEHSQHRFFGKKTTGSAGGQKKL